MFGSFGEAGTDGVLMDVVAAGFEVWLRLNEMVGESALPDGEG